MDKEILYKYATDNNGNIIYIDNAIDGVNYYCPGCKDKFIFKNGKIRQKHFAHNNLSLNCEPEGYLHKTFKKLLLDKIIKHIKENIPMEIIWKCTICGKEDNCNILNGICDVKEEYSMEVCRPDIALFNRDGKVPIVIEIIDTHEPEGIVKKYYFDNNIVLLQIKLDSLTDLENIENKIKYPLSVIYNNLVCTNCRIFLAKKQQMLLLSNRGNLQKNMSNFMNWVDNNNSGKFYGNYYKDKRGNVHPKKGR